MLGFTTSDTVKIVVAVNSPYVIISSGCEYETFQTAKRPYYPLSITISRFTLQKKYLVVVLKIILEIHVDFLTEYAS